MWEDQNPDPGGTSSKGPSPKEVSELKDQNEQQLVLIAQLKEMLRKEQSTVSQDKVEEYVNTLNRARAKRSKQKREDSSSSSTTTTRVTVNIDANKKERVNLLRQQLEENKARLAERGKSQKGIEEMVTQMQAQLKDSQTFVSSTPLSMSLVEAKHIDYSEETPQKELYNILLTKERKITELLNKSQKLEGTILDLQENLKEKDSVIDARTKAITLMTDSLSKKGKTTLDALEETKEQMRKMQENFVTLEAEMKARQLALLNDLKMKNFEISELQEINVQLEKAKLELEQKSSGRTSPMGVTENLDELLRKEIEQLQKENKKLLQKIETWESSSEDDISKQLQIKLDEVSKDNTENLSKVSQLQEALSSTLEENKVLIDANQKLGRENSKHLADISELDNQLEEARSKLIDAEQATINSSINNSKEEAMKQVIEENNKLSQENSHQLSKIHELEKQLEDALTDLKLLKNTGISEPNKSVKEESEEIVKLKKQLDESNKNMIKMRAVQKGKIKELNKKLDQFRKMNDSNALIAQLQNDISKSNEKIAELEDEKGNLQLKMVDSTASSREDPAELEEEIKLLKEKFNKTEQELGEKDKIIEILEAETIALKADLKQKSEDEIKISSHVSSEMSSICYEEQIEALELEKKKLLEQIDTLNSEKETLLQELEVVKKEKQDLSAKLDSYIQENMDLIDKLEKLSAEKVSSAESIEIVEGLTQQEKLELAAYQKHINPEEPLNVQNDDAVEPPAELNESVLQLSEDTAELLQKIEMFTQERKEVMQKMEALKDENSMLNLKVKEIENNRDILEETYEQLQNEKDVLVNKNQELSDKLDNLQTKETVEKKTQPSADILDSELKDMQIRYEALIQENDQLKRTLKELNSLVQEKYDLESRLRDVVENNTSLDTKLNSNLDEINAYQLTIEENKMELNHSTDTITKLQRQLEDREHDIQELHINISELNSVIGELQSKQSSYEIMESELDNLKSTLTDQIDQAGDYESEIAQNSDTIKKLNEELTRLNRRMLELENELELKDSEIEKLKKDINNKDEIIRTLHSEISDKDQSFKIVSEDIKAKYLALQSQLDSNDGSLRKQIVELSNKNKEQLEKMKKIAANLKKKSQAYQDLEEQYKNEKEKWQIESQEKNVTIENLKQKISVTTQALNDSESRLKTKSEENSSIVGELNKLKELVEIMEQTNADQQHYIQELKHKQEKFQETSLQQEMSASLHEEIDDSFPKHVPDDKIRELELLLETTESELNHYKERVDKLQEDARKLQEAKFELKTANAELMEKLNLTSNTFKEKALLEDQLELRLAEVTANDEAITKQLQDSQSERDELLKKNQEQEELIKRLKIKLKKAHDKVAELKAAQAVLQDLESKNQELKAQVASLEDNQRHIQNENESLQKRNLSDYEKIEADYQYQLEELLKAKNELQTDNEKLLERVKELQDREQELQMELDEYNQNLHQIEESSAKELKILKDELDTEKSQNQALQAALRESSMEIENLKQELEGAMAQITTFGSLQEQTEGLILERNNLNLSLKNTSDNLEKVLAESSDLRQTLKQTENQLEVSTQEVQTLRNETEKLKQDILALEFAKASLEASCEASQRLETQPTELLQQELTSVSNQTEQHLPKLNLSDDLELQRLNSNNPEKLKVLLKDVNDKFENSAAEGENLKQQLTVAKQELQSAKNEANSLKSEVAKLKEEVRSLKCAKSSLEVSYTPSQQCAATVSSDQEEIAKSDQVPLFSAFAQPTSSIFDNLGTLSAPAEEWFTQPNPTALTAKVAQSSTNIEPEISIGQTGQLFSSVVENGRDALIQKIKALEFLLYNVDKEKEIALEQCTQMLNEVTRIVCDTANSSPNQDLESQILSQDAVDNLSSNRHSLQHTEFTSINKDFGQKSTPVEEDIIKPKNAYICFDDDDNESTKRDHKKSADLESQILSEKDIDEASANKRDLQKLEFQKVDVNLGEQQKPVIEHLAQPKHAYLCYTKDDKPQSLEAFEENDDGWAWGPEEARLEEEHMSSLENIPQVKALFLEIQQLKENIKVLQVERDNHLEEIKQLQIKSGKLIKKCKELKTQVSMTKKPDDGGFFDLNETIQEELKLQVQQLEKKLKELTTEYEKEKAEKINLLKRVDVLTSANERMMEMKEIQDSEVLMLHRKHQEAIQKLQEYEWGSDGFNQAQKHTLDLSTPQASTSTSEDQSSKIKEMEGTIQELSLDNQELQALLEEQTVKRIEAEKNKNSGNNQELANLHRELNEATLKNGELQAEISRILSEKERLIQEKFQLETVVHSNEVVTQQLQCRVEKETRDGENDLAIQKSLLQEKDVVIGDLQTNLEQLMTRKLELDQTVIQLHQDLKLRDAEVQRLQSCLDEEAANNLDVQELKSQVQLLHSALHERDSRIEQFKAEKDDRQLELTNILQSREEEIKKITAEKAQMDLEYQAALKELDAKISQVQEDQTVINDLQSRINEIGAFDIERAKREEENQSLRQQLQVKSSELEEKQHILNDLQLKLAENSQLTASTDELLKEFESRNKEIEELKAEKLAKDAEIQRVMTDLQTKEQQFQDRVNSLVNELNENWQAQVDQRGADVAESWKMHLEMVEKDYASVQEKFKSDILELEEKCNILVNENNELRKNVDQEIQNEVDKISSLQQQISNLQQTINSLNQEIRDKNKQIEDMSNNLQTLKNENAEKEGKLAGINIIIETTQKQFDEKREVVEELVSILEKQAHSPLSYDKEDLLRELERQLGLNNEKDDEISRLNQFTKELEEKLNRISGENNREITGLNQVIEDLEKELSMFHQKVAEIAQLRMLLSDTQRENESLTLELEKLKQVHANCPITIENLNHKAQEYHSTQLSLQQSLEEKTRKIDDLNRQLVQFQQDVRNDSNKEIDSLNSALAKMEEDFLVLQGSLSECQNQLFEVTNQYQQNDAYHNQENLRLKGLLDQQEEEYHNSLEMLKNNQLADVQRHYDELLSNRDIDINALRGQVQELLNANQNCNERLNQELVVKQQVEQQLNEQTQLVNEDTKQLEELKLIIEDQVAKIEELKKELFDKSNQYDSLIAEMDVGRAPVTRQPSASAVVNPATDVQRRQYVDEDLSEPVSRAELDLSLYMLHQRDVRCEELTVELTRLLEERDTLQLRLSNALREKEELRRSITDNSAVPAASDSIEGSSTQSRDSTIVLAASGTELAKDPLENEHNLATKLSELKMVGYKKDKTFVDEQETRRMQQFAIMQQHINEVSKLPPEAAAKLVDASYTLSRDVQSPSKVLLNWLWGNNPPKANDS